MIEQCSHLENAEHFHSVEHLLPWQMYMKKWQYAKYNKLQLSNYKQFTENGQFNKSAVLSHRELEHSFNTKETCQKLGTQNYKQIFI